MKRFQSYKQLQDERGKFRGIINTGNWGEINYIETLCGKVRGGHYHKQLLELFYILEGEIEIEIKDLDGNLQETFIASPGWIFLVEPYEIHTFTSLTDSKWINILSQPLAEQEPDIYI
jgi:mannose-6-phosphate isomerase-like protein (cupin superfamily)